jgi:hypothetical protein
MTTEWAFDGTPQAQQFQGQDDDMCHDSEPPVEVVTHTPWTRVLDAQVNLF